MKEQLISLKERALSEIKQSSTMEEVDSLRVKYSGKKGELTAILKGMGKLSAEERPEMGKIANEVREAIETDFLEIKESRNMSINLENKKEIVKKFGANEKDTGSAEVQIAMLSKKITDLTEHMKLNKKDFSTKRGLLMMVGKRKRLLAYLKDINLDGYRALVKKLKLRG